MYVAYMQIVWDKAKADGNLCKHGVAFSDAARLFGQPMLLHLDTRRDYGEDRWIGLGWLGAVLVVVVFTECGDRIRIISARKANGKERKRYEEEADLGLGPPGGHDG